MANNVKTEAQQLALIEKRKKALTAEMSKLDVEEQRLKALDNVINVKVRARNLPLIEKYTETTGGVATGQCDPSTLAHNYAALAYNHGKPWSDSHVDKLAKSIQKLGIVDTARRLGRTPWACMLKLVSLPIEERGGMRESDVYRMMADVVGMKYE